MSSKQCSLAVDELKGGQNLHDENDLDFEPELKVVVSKRYRENSESLTDKAPVRIGGRITVSF